MMYAIDIISRRAERMMYGREKPAKVHARESKKNRQTKSIIIR
jgi:hypothetical protein